MKINRKITSGILAAGVLLLAGSAQLQAVPNLIVAAFATGTQGENNSQDGSYGQYNGDNLSVPYGAGTIAWDGITFDAADGSTGSAHITANFSSANNTDVLVSMAPGYNNWYYEGGSGVTGWSTGTVDGTQYHAVQFDILWDTNSTLTISQFNTGDGWPTSDFSNPGVGPNYMATNSYYTGGANVEFFTGSGGNATYIANFQIPAAAATGWQTVTVPYSDTLSGISSVAGIWFAGYFGGGGELVGNQTAAFWIDNLQLIGNVTVSPPPTVNPPTKATPGLNIFNATEGNSFYDRNQIVANATSGLSWVPGGASYSFTLAGFPANNTYGGEAYMFLIPNSTANANGEDYNQSNCFFVYIQSTPTGGQAILQFKTNQPNSETLVNIPITAYSGGPGSPVAPGGSVPTTQLLGTYTLTFTGPDAGTMTTPDGTVGTFALPAGTGAAYFTENPSSTYPFLVYLGCQANGAGAINKSVVYSSFSSSKSVLNENFLTDANTPQALQSWSTSTTHYAPGIELVPSSAAYWISWSLPDSGYSLSGTSSLKAPISWKPVSTFPEVPMFNIDTQFISTSDLQSSTNAQYFELVHRVFSQLLVLLPGQTLTPGTAPGYTGTPTPCGLNSDSGLETFTVYAVDSAYNPVAGVTDTVSVTTTDGGATTPNSAAMVNGSVQFTILYGDAGTWTITASDVTTPAITSGTSAPLVVNNN